MFLPMFPGHLPFPCLLRRETGLRLSVGCLVLGLVGCGGPPRRASHPEVGSEADPTNAASSFRIGVVHMRQVLLESAPGREAQRQLQEEAAALEQEMRTAVAALEEAEGAVETAQRRGASRQRIATLVATYQDLVVAQKEREASLRARYEQKQNAVAEPVRASARDVAARIGETEGLSIILDASAMPFFGDETNLTERVIAELDERAARAAIEEELAEGAEESENPVAP